MQALLSHPFLLAGFAWMLLCYAAAALLVARSKKIVHGYEDNSGFHMIPDEADAMIVPADEVYPAWLNPSMLQRFMASGFLVRTTA